jgi:hypothetical protein
MLPCQRNAEGCVMYYRLIISLKILVPCSISVLVHMTRSVEVYQDTLKIFGE